MRNRALFWKPHLIIKWQSVYRIFKQRGPYLNPAQGLHLIWILPRDVLTGDYLLTDWRPDLISRILEQLHPRNLRYSWLWLWWCLFNLELLFSWSWLWLWWCFFNLEPHFSSSQLWAIHRVTILSKNAKYLETKVEFFLWWWWWWWWL